MQVHMLALSVFAAVALRSTQAADSIYDIASTVDDFSTLATAAELAGLTEALSGEGSLTVFAPSNSAFAKLPEDLVNKLLDPIWQPQLKDLLLYHTLGQEVRQGDLTDGMTAETLNGESITINLNPPRVNENSKILIDDGYVDVEASNGVIHGIDTVLTPTSVTSNILEIGMANDDLTTLFKAVEAAGLVYALSGDGPITLFAPTNDAFAALDDGVLDSLLLPENFFTLERILQHHVTAANMLSRYPITMNGESLSVVKSDSGIRINGANVISTADVIGSNGIVHVIDKVLLPFGVLEDTLSIYGIASTVDDFSTLATAVEKAGLAEALSGYGSLTVFAPTNSAFAKLPEGLVNKLLDPIWQPQLKDLLFYHTLGQEIPIERIIEDYTDGMTAETLNGESITINLNPLRVNENSMILIDDGYADIRTSNGKIHGIDTVLTPTSVTSNIVEIGMANSDFTTLIKAVEAAGLVDALSGDGPFTLLAPTNDAFAALDDGVLDSLLLPENVDMLKNILTYHVAAGNIPGTAVTNGDVETLSGDSITIVVSDSGVKINEANVISTADVIGSNGIVYAIDKVLLPPLDASAPDDTASVPPPATPAPTKMPTGQPAESGAMAYGTIVAALTVTVGAMVVV